MSAVTGPSAHSRIVDASQVSNIDDFVQSLCASYSLQDNKISSVLIHLMELAENNKSFPKGEARKAWVTSIFSRMVDLEFPDNEQGAKNQNFKDIAKTLIDKIISSYKEPQELNHLNNGLSEEEIHSQIEELFNSFKDGMQTEDLPVLIEAMLRIVTKGPSTNPLEIKGLVIRYACEGLDRLKNEGKIDEITLLILKPLIPVIIEGILRAADGRINFSAPFSTGPAGKCCTVL
jgi:hypothetical protein